MASPSAPADSSGGAKPRAPTKERRGGGQSVSVPELSIALRDLRERDVVAYLVKRVQEVGGEVRKVRWLGRSGAPDTRVMLPTGGVWVELKAPGEAVKPHQGREHARMRRMGERVVVIDSIEGVDRLLLG